MGLKVVDASVIVDAFSGFGPRGDEAASLIEESSLVAPFHVDLEAMAAWRRLVRTDHMDPVSADLALSLFRRLRIKRFEHEPMLPRIWELRHNLTVADAAYVALSEHLNIPLLTSDRRLANAPGTRCEFELIS